MAYGFSSERTIDEALKESAARRGAVIGADGARLEGPALEEAVEDLASRLAEAGLRPGEAVCLCADRHVSGVVGLLALWRLQAVPVLPDALPSADGLRALLRLTGARLVITDDTHSAKIAAAGHETENTAFLALRGGGASEVPGLPPRAEGEAAAALTGTGVVPSPALIPVTGAATARPLCAPLTHESVLATAAALTGGFRLGAGKSLAGAAPLGAPSSAVSILAALLAGAEIHVLGSGEGTEACDAARDVARLGSAVWAAKAATLEALSEKDTLEDGDLPDLETLVFTDPISPRPLRYLMECLPHVRFLRVYGPAEAGFAASLHVAIDIPPADVPFTAIGRPIDDKLFYVLGADGGLAPLGAEGELVIGGPHIAKGYVGRDGAAPSRFTQWPPGSSTRVFRTGERAMKDENGVFHLLAC